MTTASTTPDPFAWLAGGGEMGERIRKFDWSRTPLGPVEQWPQSLKTAIPIILNSRYPMFIWWGRRLTNFYNDAYAPMLGRRHPDALGRPAAQIWSDVWPVVGPQTEAVLNEGHATWNQEKLLVMERHGFTEEAYFTFSYSPLPADDGRVGGVFCAVTEDTTRVLSQRRLRTLRLLAEQASKAKTAEEACGIAAATLAGNPNDLPFVLLYLLDDGGRQATLAGSTGVERNTSASPAVVELANATAPWPFRQVMHSGTMAEVQDLPQRFGPLPGGAWPESPQQAVVLPVTKPGQTQLAGFLVAGISPRLAFNNDYHAFLDLLAGHVATAVANARAYEEERRRAEALAEIDRAKTVFFSNVSHEFRTPLTLILGPLEDALAETRERPQRDRLEMLRRNALRLQKLVNTLLDFSRIEAGRIQASYEPTDLAELTTELASVFRSAVEKAGMRLIVHCPPLGEPVYVDRDMYEKIVLNLLSNAFKFTLDGEIEVKLQNGGILTEGNKPNEEQIGSLSSASLPSPKNEVSSVVLTVRDTGTGIAAEHLPKIFERFHRIEGTRARTHEGTGIGLALVQELVKLHGGEVAVQSVVGLGSTFAVSIPKGKEHLPADRIKAARQLASTALAASHYLEEALRWLPDEAATPPLADAALLKEVSQPLIADGARPRIVWADDNADMRDYVGRLLRPLYDVEAVPDGEAAVAAVHRWPPDLVLADVMMPRLDGFGLLRALRANERTRTIPVILLSARAGEEAQVEGMQAGADDYLTKPFSAREMLARVSAHIQMARLRREAQEQLAHQAGRLEHLVNERTAALRETIGELEAFSYSVAHDLRAPLRAMQGYAEVLLSENGPQLPTEHQTYLERIARAASRMDQLTREVLHYSHLSRREINPGPVDLDKLAHEVVEQYPELCLPERDIEIRSPLLPVLGHEPLLTQALSNLLLNACKFVAPGTKPKVRVWTEEVGRGISAEPSSLLSLPSAETSLVRICVEDNGIGIAHEHRDRLFKLFGRIHPEHMYEGTGMGLAIVKKAAERMGGTAGFESEVGKGSRFWIQLKAP